MDSTSSAMTAESGDFPLRNVPVYEMDAFICEVSRIAAVTFDHEKWTWGGGHDWPAHVPREAELALSIRRNVAQTLQSARDDEDSACGSGRLEARRHDGRLAVLLNLGSLNLIDWDEIERQDETAGRAAATERIADARSALRGGNP
jgi:hypothetical protein